jgi:hypothetical protein
LSSVRELEARNTASRNKLIQTISNYLDRSGVKTVVIHKPALDSFGVTLTESVIQLKEQRIESINLFKMDSAGCGDSGEALRFQYKLRLEKEVPIEILPDLRAQTKTIKVGKVLGLFGGTVTEVKWTGQKLADILNHDTEISQVLLKCTQLWGEMEISIAAISSSEVVIQGPWFTNPNTIMSLYSPDRSYEEQTCVFGYQTIDKIARRIQETLLNSN